MECGSCSTFSFFSVFPPSFFSGLGFRSALPPFSELPPFGFTSFLPFSTVASWSSQWLRTIGALSLRMSPCVAVTTGWAGMMGVEGGEDEGVVVGVVEGVVD